MGDFMKNYYTIVKSGADWRILSAKNEKIATSQNYRTQKDAIEAARNLIKNGGIVSIHSADGKIRDVISQNSENWNIKRANTSNRIAKKEIFKILADNLEKNKE